MILRVVFAFLRVLVREPTLIKRESILIHVSQR